MSYINFENSTSTKNKENTVIQKIRNTQNKVKPSFRIDTNRQQVFLDFKKILFAKICFWHQILSVKIEKKFGRF